jgi:plastocyanin
VEKTEDGSEVLKVNIEDGNFFFSPSTITAAAGQTVEVTITGHEGFHTFVISDIDLKKTLQNGASFTFVAPSTPGEYEIFCDIGNHKAQGMVGTLIVI